MTVMKRTLTIIMICLLPSLAINAQDAESKQKVYVPQKGEFSLGVDLKPILKYVGNIFNGSSDNVLNNFGGEPALNNLNEIPEIKEKIEGISPDVSIMGKYMLTNNWALRANIGLMLKNDKLNYYVQDDKAVFLNPFETAKLIDTKTSNKSGLNVMFGAEYRKGTKRIQGVFGLSALFGFHNVKQTYSYANQLTTANQNPSTSLPESAAPVSGYRILSRKSTNNFCYGGVGSAGVEWFIIPKIALGAEVNLTAYYITEGEQYVHSEGYNTSTQQVDTRYDIDPQPGNSYFRLGTGNVGGSLYLSFYF